MSQSKEENANNTTLADLSGDVGMEIDYGFYF